VPFLEAGTKLLYVRPIEPDQPATLAQACGRAQSDARAVYRALARRPGSDARVFVSLRLHLETAQTLDTIIPESADCDDNTGAAAPPAAGVSMTMAFANATGTPQE
jgi:hypothetical protein